MAMDDLEATAAAETLSHDAPARKKISWVLYDWANSGYGLIVIGPVFSPYFIKALLPALEEGSDQRGLWMFGTWVPGSAVMALLTSVSMALMAVAAPVLGAVADIKGWTKRLLMTFGISGAILAMGMMFLSPGQWMLGAVLYALSNFCFGTSFAFYNAFLPRLAPPEKQGSLSGWGFAAGYVGGAIALIGVLMMVRHDPELVPLGLALSGMWWLVFSLPAYIFLDEFPPMAKDGEGGPLLLAGFRRVISTFGHIRQYRMLFLFLLAFLLYNDGVETVISMSPAFATDWLNIEQEQLIGIFLIVQFVAFGGAVAFGYLADWLGNKPVIAMNLLLWIAVAVGAMFMTPDIRWNLFGWELEAGGVFLLLGIGIGIVLGGVQASSRSLMASLAPPAIHNEAFGFFSISGKFASIFGPLAYAGFATALGPRWGVLSVPPFLIVGLIVLMRVREPRSAATTTA